MEDTIWNLANHYFILLNLPCFHNLELPSHFVTTYQHQSLAWLNFSLRVLQVFQIAYIIIKAANSPRPGEIFLSMRHNPTLS